MGGERAQAEGTARAKALRQEGALCFGGDKRPLSQESNAAGGNEQEQTAPGPRRGISPPS